MTLTNKMKLSLRMFRIILCAGLGTLSLLSSCGLRSEWKGYQKKYFAIVAKRSGLPKGEGRVEVKILRNDELHIADRCTSCHVAMEDAAMANEANPLKAHPGDYLASHPAERFGCTSCHGGDGQSLRASKAHGMRFRKAEFVEVSCVRCHREIPSVGAPTLARGRMLLKDLQCTGCHFIEGFSEGQRMAPNLTGIGSKVNEKWLTRWLRDPKGYMPNAKMPRYEIEPRYVDAMASYLMTFKDARLENTGPRPHGDAQAGQAVAEFSGCNGCHPFRGEGGEDAPDLGRIGNKVSREWLYLMLKDPAAVQSSMPEFGLTEEQIRDLIEYLVTEFTDASWIAETDSMARAFWKNEAERFEIGRKVYKELRCANCHPRDGEEPWIQIGPILSRIGNKPVNEINFGRSQIPRTLFDYLVEKTRNPRAFATKDNPAKMPKYDLPDVDARAIALALLSFNSDTVAVKGYRVP